MNASLRIVLVEDHATVREGLRLLIDQQPDMTVVAEASNGDEAVRRPARRYRSGHYGFVDARHEWTSRRARPARKPARAKVVVLTRHADQTVPAGAPSCRVSGYVLKQSPHSELLHAIRAAAGGGQHIDSALTRHLAAPFFDRRFTTSDWRADGDRPRTDGPSSQRAGIQQQGDRAAAGRCRQDCGGPQGQRHA